jgi:tRNA (mo5U34)-methyltransferase
VKIKLFGGRSEKPNKTEPWKALRVSFRRRTRKIESPVSNGKTGSNGASHKRNNNEQKKSPLREMAIAAEQRLWKIKLAHRPKSFWYPYGTLRSVAILERLSAMADFDLLQLCRGQYGKIADIGAADGDLAFFLEKQGLCADVIENESTNFNRLEGTRILKDALDSSVTIRSVDLDSQFPFSGEKYDAIFLLGTLYHLKNPFLILERLARMTAYCFVSTRVATQTVDGQPLSAYPLAYLLGPEECNNDNTNFWIFSQEGLRRLLDRSGWNVLSYLTIGDTTNSTPADPDRDERAYCLLQSKTVPTLRAFPNPVPPGAGLGTTTISWNTGNADTGRIYVSTNGREESLFVTSVQGSTAANWIQTGSSYEFRLYDSNQAELLAKVIVTRAAQ